MLFYMHSKTFFDLFIENEKIKDILDTQYVLVSSRIRLNNREDTDNAITAINTLYPNTKVLNQATVYDMRDAYFEQLNSNKPLLASIALMSLRDKKNIIFLCSKREMRQEYMNWLVLWFKEVLNIDVYDYRMFVADMLIIKSPDKTTIDKCEKIVKKKKLKNRRDLKRTARGKEELRRNIKTMSKKEMINELKGYGLYIEGMQKYEMIEMLELFS